MANFASEIAPDVEAATASAACAADFEIPIADSDCALAVDLDEAAVPDAADTSIADSQADETSTDAINSENSAVEENGEPECPAAEDGTNVFRAGEGAGAGAISLDQAAAAASRNGIDMRTFDLQYEPGPNFGFMSTTGSGALVRGAGGRILLTLQDAGLASEQDAVETIAHELNHIRGVLGSGAVTDEASAEAAAEAAGRYYR